MASFATLNTGKIHVGAIPSANLTPSKLIPGLMTVNGPAYFGAVPAIGIDRATVCIGPSLPNAPGLPFSLEVTGLSNFIGPVTMQSTLGVFGVATKYSTDISNGLKLNNGVHISTKKKIGAKKAKFADRVISGTAIKGPVGIFKVKPFDIEHPTKDNMRLRYASLEGPENGVFIRGKTTEKVIELPDYWTGLVHSDSITVTLTPIGKACSTLHVKKIEDNKVYVGHQATELEYFYHIFAERKDVDRLVIEYDDKDKDRYFTRNIYSKINENPDIIEVN